MNKRLEPATEAQRTRDSVMEARMLTRGITLRTVAPALLLLVAVFSVHGRDSSSTGGTRWGLTVAVAPSDPGVGGVFHLGRLVVIRPTIWASFAPMPEPVDVCLSFALKCDLLLSFHPSDELMWYVGPGVSTYMLYIPGESIDARVEVAAKTGLQIMVWRRLAIYTDVGLAATGTIARDDYGQEGSLEHVRLRSFGLGAVVYVR